MAFYSNTIQKNKEQAPLASTHVGERAPGGAGFVLQDNRPKSIIQRQRVALQATTDIFSNGKIVQRVEKKDLPPAHWRIVNSEAFKTFARQTKHAGAGTKYNIWLQNRPLATIQREIAEFNIIAAHAVAAIPAPAAAIPAPAAAIPAPAAAIPAPAAAIPAPAAAIPAPAAAIPAPAAAIPAPAAALPAPAAVIPAPVAPGLAVQPAFDALLIARNIRDASDVTNLRKANIAAVKAIFILRNLAPPLPGGFVLGGSYAAFLAGNNKIPGDVDIDVRGDDQLATATDALIRGGFTMGPGSASSGKVNKVRLAIPYGVLNAASTKPANTIQATVEIANIEALNVNSKTKATHVEQADDSGIHAGTQVPTPVNMILNWLQRIKEDVEKAKGKKDFHSIRRVSRVKNVTEAQLRAAFKGPVNEAQVTLFNRLKSAEPIAAIIPA